MVPVIECGKIPFTIARVSVTAARKTTIAAAAAVASVCKILNRWHCPCIYNSHIIRLFALKCVKKNIALHVCAAIDRKKFLSIKLTDLLRKFKKEKYVCMCVFSLAQKSKFQMAFNETHLKMASLAR